MCLRAEVERTRDTVLEFRVMFVNIQGHLFECDGLAEDAIDVISGRAQDRERIGQEKRIPQSH